MGQAKRRGTYEQRKNEAIKHNEEMRKIIEEDLRQGEINLQNAPKPIIQAIYHKTLFGYYPISINPSRKIFKE